MIRPQHKTPGSEWKEWNSFSLAIALLLLIGCGGGGGGGNSGSGGGNPQNSSCSTAVQPIIPPTNVTYSSDAALDGSDAVSLNDTSNIWLVKTDGSSRAPLTKLTQSGSGSVNPVLSPDGTRIAFASARALDGSDNANTNGTSNIWVMHADGSGAVPITRLTANGANSNNQTWSRDGTKIAFVSARALDGSDAVNLPNGDSNIWIVNADGSNATPVTRLTQIPVGFPAVSGPQWSPNGSKLAFASVRALNGSDSSNAHSPACCISNIWVINADGSGASPLTRLNAVLPAATIPFTTADSFRPQWSPDGTKIVFDSAGALDGSNAENMNTNFNIWVVNADGSARTPLTKLTFSGGDQSHVVSGSIRPVWSPDGKKIAFDSDRALDGTDTANAPGNNHLVNKSNIWSMNADGSCATPRTKLTAAGLFHPVWLADSATIVYESDRALDGSDSFLPNFLIFNIWVINGDGSSTPLTKLTKAENALAN